MDKHLGVAAIGIAVLFGVAAFSPRAHESWPAHTVDGTWLSVAQRHAKARGGRGYIRNFQDYKSDGPYLGWANSKYEPGDRLELDEAGLPKVKYRDTFYYNPVTMSQFSLAMFSRGDDEHFLAAADKLLGMQSDDGAYRYQFQYTHYTTTQPYAIGWTSGMAQGQSLSALARAYARTGDERYLAAGEKALAFLQVQHPNGPMSDLSDLDPSLASYSFILEYPTEPNAYTLNGYIFALLGLHD